MQLDDLKPGTVILLVSRHKPDPIPAKEDSYSQVIQFPPVPVDPYRPIDPPEIDGIPLVVQAVCLPFIAAFRIGDTERLQTYKITNYKFIKASTSYIRFFKGFVKSWQSNQANRQAPNRVTLDQKEARREDQPELPN